jgi:superfamily II DNA/RNA helicase
LTITNVDPKERPKILAISSFAQNFHVEDLKEESGVSLRGKTHLMGAFREWLYSLDRSEFTDTSAWNIVRYYLDGANAPRGTSKEQKAQLKGNARDEGERLFERFLHEALLFEDQQKLDFKWNRLFNGQSSVQHHKIPIGFDVSSKFKGFDLEIRPAQREGVAFMELAGSGIIAYDVGVGKTLTAIIELANSMFSGKCKRPMIVVPNPTYKKWIEEIVGVTDKQGKVLKEGILTGTGITINDWYNLGTGIKDKINFNKAVPEKSITMLTYEGFKKIGFGDQVSDELFVELANILGQSSFSKEKESSHKSARDSEIEYQKYREKIGVGVKGTIADIETLGFDYIVVDEAHRCKNVFDSVKLKERRDTKRFNIKGQVSETGIKAFFICNYIQRKVGKNVCLLTATPFTNSALEIYSMLSLVAYDNLQKMNIYNINEFFETFVLPTYEYVANYKNEIEEKEVVKSFNNRLVLQKLIYNNINYKTGEEAGVKRPCKVNLPRVNVSENGAVKRLSTDKQILTYLKPTPIQQMNQREIVNLAKSSTRGKLDMANLLRSLNYSLDNALSPYLYNKEDEPEDFMQFVEESPKIHYILECVRSVKEYHEKRKEAVSGQVIYMNRGKQFFHFIQDYLVHEVGYKEKVDFLYNNRKYKINEVEIIDSSVSSTKKEMIKEAFLAGTCKIIIGTATIREGIDLQKKGTVIYNAYPDWNPTDIRQLEGRVWRQGNEFGYVRVVMPLVQDSMDVFIFQKLEEKSNRINDIWYRGDRGNVLDLESLDPEEVKFALITNLEELAKVELSKLTKMQNRKIENIQHHIKVLKDFTRDYSNYQHYRQQLLSHITMWEKVFAGLDWVKRPYSKKQLKELSKEDSTQYEKDLVLYNDLKSFQEKVPQEDKDILRMARRIYALRPSFDFYRMEYFKEYLSKIKKAEKSILSSGGYTLEDNMEEIVSHFEADLEKEKKELERINGTAFKMEIIEEIEAKKKAMAVQGKSIYDRVKEFKNLNHLLDYRFTDIDLQSCEIPSAGLKPAKSGDDDFQFKLQVQKRRAKAKLLLMN